MPTKKKAKKMVARATKKAAKKTSQKAGKKARVIAKRIIRKLAKKKVKLQAKRRPASVPRPSRIRPIPYVLKPSFAQVTIGGQPFTLHSSHPTFKRLAVALKGENWKLVPQLITLAHSLMNQHRGAIEVKNGVVFYKGTAIDSTLTQRIVDMIQHGKQVSYMVKFMENLYKNPEPLAIEEFYDWLRGNNLPITDDGCFLAYKSVNKNLRDEHTDSIDNSPGKTPYMRRNEADLNWRTQCSSGYHVCSKQYGFYGSRVMAVKVNPKDVISANDGKMRVLRYEVIRELGSKTEDLFKFEGYSELEKTLVVEIRKERKELIVMLMRSPKVKRLLRNQKLQPQSIKRATYARLQTMAKRFDLLPEESDA